MNKSRDVLAQTGFSSNSKRALEDFYETPEWATYALFARETFQGQGWEPASGGGRISRIMEGYATKNFMPMPYSTDLRNDEGVYGEKGANFFFQNKQVDFIITNPPFKLALEFAKHSLECAPKVAMFVRLQFLEGKERYGFFKENPPERIYIFSSRVGCLKDGKPEPAIMCFAWFVWNRGFKGKPTIEWIEPR